MFGHIPLIMFGYYQKYVYLMLISGFRRDVNEICALLGYYTASCGNCLPIRCPETSINNYHRTPCNVPEERRSYLMLILNSVFQCILYLRRIDK
jgi:hypothetical protein